MKSSRHDIVKAIACAFFASVLSVACTAAYAVQNKALLIGISQYTELDSLRYADADASEFSQLLTDFAGYQKSDVTLLLNQQATKKRIVDEINKVVRDSEKQPLDTFILVFAGHGMESVLSARNAKESSQERETNIFLAPSDASTEENNFYSEGQGKQVSNDTFINKAWLARQLSAIKAKSIIIILDSCYSGTRSFGTLFLENEGYTIQSFGPSSGSQRGVAVTQRKLVLSQSRQESEPAARKIAYFASSRDDQASAEYDELRHGALSYCILEYIKRVQREVNNDAWQTLSINGAYSNITKLFHETEVKGKTLDVVHQPILLSIPDYAAVKDMAFLTVRGVKEKEIPKEEPAKVVLPPVELPKAELPQKELSEEELLKEALLKEELRKEELRKEELRKEQLRQEELRREELNNGMLFVTTEPAGLEVFVDGVKRDEVTNASLKLPIGKHSIELFLPSTGYRYSFTADISNSSPVRKALTLRGELEVASFWLKDGVKSSGPQLDVYLDGTYVGQSLLRQGNLLAGTHEIKVTYKNVAKSRHIEIRPDSPLRINYSVIQEKAPPRDERGVGNVVF